MKCAQSVHHWLGAAYDQKKLQLGPVVDILGITYDFDRLILRIKEGRKEELLEEIQSILDADLLEPGHAGKLKGKLMFAASHLWGKVGRAFLLAISERQYFKPATNSSVDLRSTSYLSATPWSNRFDNG